MAEPSRALLRNPGWEQFPGFGRLPRRRADLTAAVRRRPRRAFSSRPPCAAWPSSATAAASRLARVLSAREAEPQALGHLPRPSHHSPSPALPPPARPDSRRRLERGLDERDRRAGTSPPPTRNRRQPARTPPARHRKPPRPGPPHRRCDDHLNPPSSCGSIEQSARTHGRDRRDHDRHEPDRPPDGGTQANTEHGFLA